MAQAHLVLRGNPPRWHNDDPKAQTSKSASGDDVVLVSETELPVYVPVDIDKWQAGDSAEDDGLVAEELQAARDAAGATDIVPFVDLKTWDPGEDVDDDSLVAEELEAYRAAARDAAAEALAEARAHAEWAYATRRDHRAVHTAIKATAAEWNQHVDGCAGCATEDVATATENLRMQRGRSRNATPTLAAETRLRKAVERRDRAVAELASLDVAPVVDGPTETFAYDPKDKSLRNRPKKFVAEPSIAKLADELRAAAPKELPARLTENEDDDYEEDLIALAPFTREEQLAMFAHADSGWRKILTEVEPDEDIQMALLGDDDPTLRGAMTKSPLAAPAVLRAAYAQKTHYPHFWLARNPSTPRDILWNIVTNPNEDNIQRMSARGILLWRDAQAERGEEYDPRAKILKFVNWSDYCWERQGTFDAPNSAV